jgi:hypothetical protein
MIPLQPRPLIPQLDRPGPPVAGQRSPPTRNRALETFSGDELIKLETLEDFRRAVAGGTGVIAIRDPAITKVHIPSCTLGVQQQHFLAKTARATGSAGYYGAPTVEAVRARWPGARGCRACGS